MLLDYRDCDKIVKKKGFLSCIFLLAQSYCYFQQIFNFTFFLLKNLKISYGKSIQM